MLPPEPSNRPLRARCTARWPVWLNGWQGRAALPSVDRRCLKEQGHNDPHFSDAYREENPGSPLSPLGWVDV